MMTFLMIGYVLCRGRARVKARLLYNLTQLHKDQMDCWDRELMITVNNVVEFICKIFSELELSYRRENHPTYALNRTEFEE